MQGICVYDTYNVPFLSIITVFLITLNASFFAHKHKINTIMIPIMINNS